MDPPPSDNFESEKNKYILSIWKKVNSKNHLHTSPKPDVAVIVCLLKTMGFQLEKFERQDNPESNDIPLNNITLTMQCGSSKMQAVMKMDDVNCQCPDLEEQSGSFWSITGSDNVNKVEETGSTLLPQMSKDKNVILKQIIQSLCEIIQEKPNEDADKSTSSVCMGMLDNNRDSHKMYRSSTQPEIKVTGRTSLPANYKPFQTFNSNMLRTISPVSSNMSSTSESSQRQTPIRHETFTIEETDKISSQNSNNNVLEYILKSLRDLEQVVEKHIKKPLSSSQWSLNDEIFQKPSLVFDDLTSKGSMSRAGTTMSLESCSRTSTTLKKSNIQGSIAAPCSGTSKLPITQTRKMLNVPAKVNTGRTTSTTSSQPVEKKKYLGISERSVQSPRRDIRRRASDIGIGASQRTTTIGRTQAPLSTKTPTLKVTVKTSTPKFGFKK